MEFFRLPPILAPLLGFPEEKGGGDPSELPATNVQAAAGGSGSGAPAGHGPTALGLAGRRPRRRDSLSSVEPNVESSLSSLSGSSGAEESDDSSTELPAPAPAATAPAPAAPEVQQRTKSATPHRRAPPMYKPSPPRASTARPKPQGCAGSAARAGAAGGSVGQLTSAPQAPPVVPLGPAPPAAPPTSTAQGKTREQGNWSSTL